MRDIRGFSKLFDLNVPNYEHFDYYISQYMRLKKWSNLLDLIKLWEDFESYTDDTFQYKIEKSNQVIEFIKKSRAYSELNDDNLIESYPTNKNFEWESGKKYLSIDINSANWVALKRYDPEFLNELGDSYQDLLKKFNIHPVFWSSKQFRQYIFGNINPKKQVRVQRSIIEDLIKTIPFTPVCIKTDEVIYEFNDQLISNINVLGSDFKWKLFKVEGIEDFRVNSYFDLEDNLLHKELTGCNGNKYFINLKRWIFNEPLDIRDLYFRMDGDLAIWNVSGLKLKLVAND
jgi:hypothetical protein